jgi:hypothetical protein
MVRSRPPDVYDTFDQTARKVDRSLAVGQAVIWSRTLAWMFTGNIRRVFPPDTYKTMLAEDFTPTGFAQTRKEIKAVAAAIHPFRAEPPAPHVSDRPAFGIPSLEAPGKPAAHRRAPATVRRDAARRAIRSSRFKPSSKPSSRGSSRTGSSSSSTAPASPAHARDRCHRHKRRAALTRLPAEASPGAGEPLVANR